jgi:hypothetical protein
MGSLWTNPSFINGVIGVGGSLLSAGMASKASSDAADTYGDAQREATEAQLGFQREQLDYLKELDRLPREYRDAALTQLGNAYTGDQAQQQTFIDRARNSPIYAAIMGGRKEGEDAILRNASATGGLRSGNVKHNLYDSNVLLENKALLTAYQDQIQGVAGLAGTPGYGTQVANVMGGMGDTVATGIAAEGQADAQGQIASAQAWQQGIQGAGSAIGTGVGNYLWAKGKGVV